MSNKPKDLVELQGWINEYSRAQSAYHSFRSNYFGEELDVCHYEGCSEWTVIGPVSYEIAKAVALTNLVKSHLKLQAVVNGLPPIPDDPEVPNQVLELFLR